MLERNEYQKGKLDISDLNSCPIKQFQSWFEFYTKQCESHSINNAMTLATSSKEGAASARTVLLKEVDRSGFIFYTNYKSKKGRQLKENPHASLVFYWPELERQVIVDGETEKISSEESDEYFKSRPVDAQIAAICSQQSEVTESRISLEDSFKRIKKDAEAGSLKRPEHWGGYRLVPSEIEFWQGRENRLNDRLRYRRNENKQWVIERLQS